MRRSGRKADLIAIFITLEVILSDSIFFSCMDGTLRDLAALRGTYRLIPETDGAVKLMFDVLEKAKVRMVRILLDEPVSNSGRLKARIADIAERLLMMLDISAQRAIYEELKVIRSSGLDQSADDIIPNVLKITVCSQRSEAGKLHVTGIEGAFGALRQHLYLAGMSASNYPGAPKENYLLLDADLKLFGPKAERYTADGRILRKREQLLSLVKLAAALGTDLSVSYAGLNVSELKKDNASSMIFELFREAYGRDVSAEELEEHTTRVEYFEPAISASRRIGEAYTKGNIVCPDTKKAGAESAAVPWNRSTRTLCEYFNRVFTALLPEETENQSRFEEIPLPETAEGEFQGVYTYKAYTGQAEAEHPDMTDPVQIANIVESLVGNERFLIRGEKEKKLRPIRYSDVMVITYGKKKLGPIMAELDTRNIPTKVEGDVPFASNQALYELSLIYAAVADAEDSLALYGALTGGLIALTKEDILRFKACGGTVSLKTSFDKEACSDETALKVAAQIEGLKELYTAALRLSPAALYSGIMDEYCLYRTAPAENLEVVYYALELIRNAQESGLVVSPKDGAAYIRGLIAGASGEERCLSLTADKDCVHMANLHKVKGLEAPIVILAAASNSTFSGSYRMIHGDDGSEGYIFSLESERDENGRSKTYFSTADYSDEKAEEAEALKAENQRLIYVAATRARNTLILCNRVQVSRGKESISSKWGPITEAGLSDIFEVIGDSTGFVAEAGEEIDAAALYEEAKQETVLNDRTAEEATFKVENPSRLHVLSKLSESPEAGGEEEAPETVSDAMKEKEAPAGGRRFAALLGTMTHKLMEMLVTTRNTVDARAAVGEIIREYSTPGTEGYEGRLTETLLKAADRMRSGGYAQTNGLPQDILSTLLAADEVNCEVPFSYKDDSDETTVWNGVMDVIYSRDGEWHIVDYKTNADGNDLDARYQAQLSAYVKAFKATTGLDVDALTYHIDI